MSEEFNLESITSRWPYKCSDDVNRIIVKLADEVGRLRKVLANEVKHHVVKIEQIAALKQEVEGLRMQWERRIESIAEPYMLEARTLKAENETFRKQRDDEAWYHAACLSIAEGQLDGRGFDATRFSLAMKACVELRNKYLAFKNWQPSDPGTKEAMKTCRPQSDEEGEKRMSWVDTAMTLSHALTAAMVRLEEAEKRVKYMDEQEVGYLDTINTLESQLAALTALLAELRKRIAVVDNIVDDLRCICLDNAAAKPFCVWCVLRAALASPPSPAPVESKPKEGKP